MPRHVLLPVLALLALALGAPAAAQAARPAYRGIGILSIQDGTKTAAIDAELDAAKRMGANSVRTTFSWAALEPAPGQYDPAYVATLDHLFERARKLRIKPMVTFLGTPCWTSTYAEKGDCSSAAQRTEADRWPPEDDVAYGRAAAFIAGRYADALAGLEIWNEPDQVNQLYWAGPGKVVGYANLLKAAYPQIKAAAPKVTVIGAAIVGYNGKFLEALYAQGIKGYYDAIGVHYYDLVLSSLAQIRKVQLAHGDRKPLWLGEFGWSSCATGKKVRRQGPHVCVTQAMQARNTVDIFRALARKKGSYVQGALVYTMQDSSVLSFGAYDSRGRAKPLVSALKAPFAGRPGKVRKLSLTLRRRGAQIVASGTGPAGDAYELDVWQGRTLRYRAAYRLDRNGRFSLKLPAALGTRGLRVKVFQYWLGGGVTRRI